MAVLGALGLLGCSSVRDCNPFARANENTDTVKVNLQLHMQSDKENTTPNPRPLKDGGAAKVAQGWTLEAQREHDIAAAAEAEFVAEQQRTRLRASRDRAELEAQRLAAELAEEEEAEAAELLRREQAEAANAEALRAKEAAEWQRKQEQLEVLRQQQLQESERAKCEREKMDRLLDEAEQERMREEAGQKAVDREKVFNFMLEHGYTDVNGKRRRGLKSKYPLHTAVKLADEEMVLLLLARGAHRHLKNSAGETPVQLAGKLNKLGSHAGVCTALSSPAC